MGTRSPSSKDMPGKDFDDLTRGLVCPTCGQTDRLLIAAQTTIELVHDGSEDCGDHEWDDDSPASCPVCRVWTRVINFFPEIEECNDFIVDGDQPTECPKCQARTDFKYVIAGCKDSHQIAQKHTCLGCKHIFFTIGDSEE